MKLRSWAPAVGQKPAVANGRFEAIPWSRKARLRNRFTNKLAAMHGKRGKPSCGQTASPGACATVQRRRRDGSARAALLALAAQLCTRTRTTPRRRLVAKGSYWLPAPEGEFIPMLRMHWTKEKAPTILDGSWDATEGAEGAVIITSPMTEVRRG
jgi:hypothetical protein